MMMNYFTPMDPSSSYLSINWFLLIFPFLPMFSFFLHPTRFSILIFNMNKFLMKEINPIIKFINTPSFIIPFLSIFFMIFSLNFMSLFPYIFTPSSHMNLNFSLSFTFWLTLILFAWMNNMSSMSIHLTPENTPPPLIPFMILIEIISQSIRPLTLSVRLTTNMIAGHLMMTLLSSTAPFLSLFTSMFTLLPLMILMILETAMALIQAYIFMILLILYSKEMA